MTDHTHPTLTAERIAELRGGPMLAAFHDVTDDEWQALLSLASQALAWKGVVEAAVALAIDSGGCKFRTCNIPNGGTWVQGVRHEPCCPLVTANLIDREGKRKDG